MKSRLLIAVTAVALAATGLSFAQPQAAPGVPVQPAGPPAPGVGSPPPAPQEGQPVPSLGQFMAVYERRTEVKPEDLTIEQLIETMEKTRAEIVEREKKNQAMLKVLQEKVGKVKVRMDSFSDKPQPVEKPAPERESLNDPRFTAPIGPSINPPKP